jgi:hypothetical protein
MRKRIEIKANQRFNRLRFLAEEPSINNRRRGLFLCDCGNVTRAAIHDVRSGHTCSCGCFHTERQRSARTHGATLSRQNPPEYIAWKAMKARCYDRKTIGYKNYGGRGIRVCEKWLNDYPAFLKDVGMKPTPEHSLDRIENDGDYEPGNCKWSTKVEQRRNNRQGVHPVTINGITKIICDWAKASGVPEEAISSRLRHGWDPERAVYCPLGRAHSEAM